MTKPISQTEFRALTAGETQTSLPGISRAAHAHLGKVFESELAAVHDHYRRQGIVDIVQNPNAFDFAAGAAWHRTKDLFEQGDGRAAKTGDGRILMRVYSDVDFSGGGRAGAFCFDAKETKGKRFPLASVKSHQVRRLAESARCGVTAGLIVKFSELDRVFFLPAAILAEREETLIKLSAGRKSAPKGTASISVEEMESAGVEIYRNKMNELWDWIKILGGR